MHAKVKVSICMWYMKYEDLQYVGYGFTLPQIDHTRHDTREDPSDQLTQSAYFRVLHEI